MISKCLNHMVVTSIVMEHSWHFFFRHTILVLFVIKVQTFYNDFNWMNLNAYYLFYYIRFGHVKFFWSGLHTSQCVLFDVILHTLVYLSNYCQNQDVQANSNIIICYEYNFHQNDTISHLKKKNLYDNVGKKSKRKLYINMLKL